MEVGEFQLYRIGGFKGHRWYNKHLDRMRSKRDRCKKGARRYTCLTQVYKRISERKHNKQRDSLHKASHLLAHKVVERTVVIGDLSQKQMVTNAHKERNKHLKRWTTSGVSSPLCRCSHTLERQDQVHLTQREQEKLLLFVAAELARKRQGRGLKLNYPEAIAILSAEILEAARDGKSVSEIMSFGTTILKREDVMDGIAEMIHDVQVEATFPDGTKLVTIHDPIR